MRLRPLLLIPATLCLILPACETTGPGSSGGLAADHKPNYDYWQNGGGA